MAFTGPCSGSQDWDTIWDIPVDSIVDLPPAPPKPVVRRVAPKPAPAASRTRAPAATHSDLAPTSGSPCELPNALTTSSVGAAGDAVASPHADALAAPCGSVSGCAALLLPCLTASSSLPLVPGRDTACSRADSSAPAAAQLGLEALLEALAPLDLPPCSAAAAHEAAAGTTPSAACWDGAAAAAWPAQESAADPAAAAQVAREALSSCGSAGPSPRAQDPWPRGPVACWPATDAPAPAAQHEPPVQLRDPSGASGAHGAPQPAHSGAHDGVAARWPCGAPVATAAEAGWVAAVHACPPPAPAGPPAACGTGVQGAAAAGTVAAGPGADAVTRHPGVEPQSLATPGGPEGAAAAAEEGVQARAQGEPPAATPPAVAAAQPPSTAVQPPAATSEPPPARQQQPAAAALPPCRPPPTDRPAKPTRPAAAELDSRQLVRSTTSSRLLAAFRPGRSAATAGPLSGLASAAAAAVAAASGLARRHAGAALKGPAAAEGKLAGATSPARSAAAAAISRKRSAAAAAASAAAALATSLARGGACSPTRVPPPGPEPRSGLSGSRATLLAALDEWRTLRARSCRKSPDALLRWELLLELASRCPTSVLLLDDVPGLPRPWVRAYGQEVLDVCRNHVHVRARQAAERRRTGGEQGERRQQGEQGEQEAKLAAGGAEAPGAAAPARAEVYEEVRVVLEDGPAYVPELPRVHQPQAARGQAGGTKRPREGRAPPASSGTSGASGSTPAQAELRQRLLGIMGLQSHVPLEEQLKADMPHVQGSRSRGGAGSPRGAGPAQPPPAAAAGVGASAAGAAAMADSGGSAAPGAEDESGGGMRGACGAQGGAASAATSRMDGRGAAAAEEGAGTDAAQYPLHATSSGATQEDGTPSSAALSALARRSPSVSRGGADPGANSPADAPAAAWLPPPPTARVRMGPQLASASPPAVHMMRVVDLLGLLAEVGRAGEALLEAAGVAAGGGGGSASASAASSGSGPEDGAVDEPPSKLQRTSSGSSSVGGVSSDGAGPSVAGSERQVDAAPPPYVPLVPAAALAAAQAMQSVGRVAGQQHIRRLRQMVGAVLPAWEVRRVLACRSVGASAWPRVVLRLPAAAGPKDVRLAFRRLSLLVHPDKNRAEGAAEAFALVKAAAGVLLREAPAEARGESNGSASA